VADEWYLRRVLLNLLDNAIKFNVDGGSLFISLAKLGEVAEFRIGNTGPGITKENENRVFDRFYRADPSRSSETSGAGLGLSICREIVAAHGGRMWLEQPRPGWTEFVVALSGQTADDSKDKRRMKTTRRVVKA
jgi:signal transduction histidine kinase